MYAELKLFITQENAKTVKEIKDSNERRLVAIEDALSFAMDSLTAVSERQRTASQDIQRLQRETEDLKQRLQQLEDSEDRQQQARRLVCLIFSGPELQRQTCREDAARLIKAVVQRYLGHSLDSSQVRTMIRLNNGKMIVEFTTTGHGSDRDIIYRSKSKLKGSGLYIAESLTPRRQAMFSQLLQLKREGTIFSVFTRSGDILVCRSRNSAPVRIGGPDAVQKLSGTTAAAERPARGRSRAADGEARLDTVPASGGREGTPRMDEVSSPSIGGGMEVELPSPADPTSRSQGASYSGSRRPSDVEDGGAKSAETGRAQHRDRPVSSLLECAQETVQLVQLSPPLQGVPSEGAAGGSSAGGGELAEARGGSPVAAVAESGEEPPDGGPAVDRPSGGGDLEPPLPGASEVVSQSAEGSTSERTETPLGGSVSDRSSGLPSGGRHRGASECSSTRGGDSRQTPQTSSAGVGSRAGMGSGAAGGAVGRAADAGGLAGDSRHSSVGSRKTGATSRSKSIRDYF